MHKILEDIFLRYDLEDTTSLESIRAKCLCEGQDIYLALFYSLESILTSQSNHAELLSLFFECQSDEDIDILFLYLIEIEKYELVIDLQVQNYLNGIDQSKLSLAQVEYFKEHYEINQFDFSHLTGKEKLLAEYLANQNADKYTLIEVLYPNATDFFKAEKSFKVLMGRLRKKIPYQLVLTTSKMYQLSL